eukprot:1745810-Pleurochrysis_carterae.AAC.2
MLQEDMKKKETKERRTQAEREQPASCERDDCPVQRLAVKEQRSALNLESSLPDDVYIRLRSLASNSAQERQRT